MHGFFCTLEKERKKEEFVCCFEFILLCFSGYEFFAGKLFSAFLGLFLNLNV